MLLLGLAGVAAACGGEERAPEPAPEVSGRLPEPQPPQRAPLRSPEVPGVIRGLGWEWLNPQPRAMEAWLGVDVLADGAVALAGSKGVAAHLRGRELVGWATGTDEDLHAIAWLGPAQAIAVGDAGIGRLLLQSGTRALPLGTEESLRAVVALGATDAIAVGTGGVIVHLASLSPMVLETPVSSTLFAVHGEAGDEGTTFWAAGQGGVILRGDTGTGEVVQEKQGGEALRGISRCGGVLYAAGQGSLWRRDEDAQWSRVRPAGVELRGLGIQGLGCQENNLVVAGREGEVAVLRADRGVAIPSGEDLKLRGIASGGEHTWLVGDGGQLASLHGGQLRLLSGGNRSRLWDANTLGGLVVVVGSDGVVLRQGQNGISRAPLPDENEAALLALAKVDDARLLAVGEVGSVYEITWNAIRRLEVPGEVRQTSFRDAVGLGGGEVLIVGDGGMALRGMPGALAVVPGLAGAGNLRAVETWGDAAVVVGDGAAFRISRQGAEALALEGCPGNAPWRAVHPLEDGSLLLGAQDGRIVRRDNAGRCHQERAPEGTLWAFGPGPDGKPWALGRFANVGSIAREAEGEVLSWAARSFAFGGAELRSLHGEHREVFAVGTRGLVLRHPRL